MLSISSVCDPAMPSSVRTSQPYFAALWSFGDSIPTKMPPVKNTFTSSCSSDFICPLTSGDGVEEAEEPLQLRISSNPEVEAHSQLSFMFKSAVSHSRLGPGLELSVPPQLISPRF